MTTIREINAFDNELDASSAAGTDPAFGWQHLPAAIQALRPAALEVEARPSRMSKIKVLDYRPTHQDYSGFLAKPGTITLFVARRNAEVLEQIRRAVNSDGCEDRELASRFARQFQRRTMVSLEEAVTALIGQPVFASVRYCGRTLAQSLFAPDGVDACIVPMAYNGGYLARNSFRLVEHYLPDADTRLDAVAVRHAPPLTSAERAALRAVPPDQREWSIAQPGACYAITAVTVTLVLAGATYACPGVTEPETLPAEEIKAIGPEATARWLLAIRRRLLEAR